MTMQHLERELRSSGDPHDKERADIIAAMRRARGIDIDLPQAQREARAVDLTQESLEIGGVDFKKSFVELVENLGIKHDLTLEKTKEILEKVRKGSVQIATDSVELLSQLLDKQINISRYALDMLISPDFTTLPNLSQIRLGTGQVSDLVPNPTRTYATTAEIWAARDEKGLEPVLAETALHYLLQKGDQIKVGDPWLWMSMQTIADRHGRPSVFGVGRDDDGLWLDGGWTGPSDRWLPGTRFAFSLPQVTES